MSDYDTDDSNSDWITRIVRVGGMSKDELLEELDRHGVKLNEYGQLLFADERFTTSEASYAVECVQTSVFDLGFPHGATIAQIHERAAERRLACCPLELGPHLRLQFLDQPEGHFGQPPSQHRAPPGSLTMASKRLSEDDETPQGFYLRRICSVLWLRGYRSGPEHIYSPEDRFVFCRQGDTASSTGPSPAAL
jgi:hypothetical protein